MWRKGLPQRPMKYTDTNRPPAAKFPGAPPPSGLQTWIARRRWDKLPAAPRRHRAARRQEHVWKRHAAFAGTTEGIRRAGLSVLPELLQRGRDRAVTRRRR